jgi:hypothetical protein
VFERGEDDLRAGEGVRKRVVVVEPNPQTIADVGEIRWYARFTILPPTALTRPIAHALSGA